MTESNQGIQALRAALGLDPKRPSSDGKPAPSPAATPGSPQHSPEALAASSAQPHTPSLTASAVDWRWPLAGTILLLAIIGWLFSDFLIRQFEWAIREQADWGHTLVIPFISLYFVYYNREKLLAKPFHTNWLGLLPIVIGVAWYVFSTIGPPTIRHHNIQGAGLCITIFGLVLLFCGLRATTILLFPMAYLFIFGQTLSYRLLNIVTFKLQDIAAVGSHIMLVLMGFDAERAGNVLTVFTRAGEERMLNIAEACSGMRMLMAFLALGTAMAYLGLKFMWQRVLLVLLAFPTAIFVNILRVVTLALLAMVDSDLAAGDFHTFIGLIWLLPAFFIFLGCMWLVKHTVVEEEADEAETT